MTSKLSTGGDEWPPLILASASASRAAMLENAGLAAEISPADIDETAVKREMRAGGAAPGAIAARLAAEKAKAVSMSRPEALVIGADQVLVCDGRLFDKPAGRAAAQAALFDLRGRSHELISAVAIAEAGDVVWETEDRARLTMRSLSDEFVDWYLDRIGDAALASVGAYQLEGLGAQLFDRVEGDFFTILGLPLLPVLDFLRRRGIVRR